MKWIKNEESYRIPVKSWCAEVEPGALKQAGNLAAHPVLAHHVALMPDCHQGYGMPIGGVVAAATQSFRARSASISAAAWWRWRPASRRNASPG